MPHLSGRARSLRRLVGGLGQKTGLAPKQGSLGRLLAESMLKNHWSFTSPSQPLSANVDYQPVRPRINRLELRVRIGRCGMSPQNQALMYYPRQDPDLMLGPFLCPAAELPQLCNGFRIMVPSRSGGSGGEGGGSV